jgi:putative ABC transport system permease protein
VPLVFLGVAAFLVNLVLSRLISLQRQEIAMLKAIGYTNLEISRHYLLLIAVVMVPGALLGVAGGYALGRWLITVYASVFRFPDLSFALSPWLVASGLAVSVGAAALGGIIAARSATRLPPAQAMRAPAPAHYGRGVVERLRLGALVGPTGMMIVREIERRPLRTALSATGIAGAVALLILGRFGTDSLDNYLEETLRREQRHDLAVAFARPMSPRVVGQLARSPGVVTAEGLRAVPIRVRHEHRMRDSAFMGLPARATLRRLIDHGRGERQLPARGVLVSKTLADVLGFGAGDRLEVELRDGERRTVHVTVAGLITDSVGMFVYGRDDLLAGLERDSGAVSTVLMRVDPSQLATVEAQLRRSPHAIDVAELDADVQRLRDMNGAAMDVWTAVSITLAGCVIFGLVYNNARIALAMRSRDLASLRVLGFFRREISTILIAGLAIEVALAIPVGLWLGRRWGELFMRTVDRETFRFAVVVAPRTYVLCALVAVLAAAASALWVRRSLDRLDLIAVLKTRE